MVRPVGPGNGRSAARRAAVPGVRRTGQLDGAAARREHHPAVPSLLERHKPAAQILALVNDILRDKGLMLRAGTVVDATLISTPNSIKNASGELGDASEQERQPVVLRHESARRRGCPIRAGAHGAGHVGQRQHRGRSQQPTAWRGNRRVWRFGLTLLGVRRPASLWADRLGSWRIQPPICRV